jgi:hypothetical protein
MMFIGAVAAYLLLSAGVAVIADNIAWTFCSFIWY